MKIRLSQGAELQNGIFRIDKYLGSGGFGITYLATWILGQQTKLKFIKTGEKTVVIKEFFYEDYCMRADNSNEILITDAEKRTEFERLRRKLVGEANILNSFKHPHIVEVFDVFEENNTAYIVMEYVDGEDFEALISRKKKCQPDEAVRYIDQIASALIEVHNRQVLHLDISPGNILIDKNDNAQLIDFGVSLSYDHDTGEVKQTSKLLAGKKSGFSPPEQSSITSLQSFSPPIDLYALGATLYNALTGRKPPESGSLSAGSELLALPSSFNPEVSDYLDHFVLKAMSIKVSDRFQTAASFQDALLHGEQQYSNAIRQGNACYASGKYEEALRYYEAACKVINTNDDLNRKVNRCKLKMEEGHEQEILEQKIQVLLNRANLLYQNNDYEQAISVYNQVLALEPNDAYATRQIQLCREWINTNLHKQALEKGDTYFNKGDYEEAIKAYEEALSYKKGDVDTLAKIAICKKEKSTGLLDYRQQETPEHPQSVQPPQKEFSSWSNNKQKLTEPSQSVQPPQNTENPKPYLTPKQAILRYQTTQRNKSLQSSQIESKKGKPFVLQIALIGAIAAIIIGFLIWIFLPKGEPAWIEQYNKHLSSADNYYDGQNYDSAVAEYTKALQSIPSKAKNAYGYSQSVNAKINDSSQKKREQDSIMEARDRAELLEKERIAKETAVADNILNASQTETARQEKLRTLRSNAQTAFNAKNWNRAFTAYQEIKTLDPTDYTGYNNFLNLAKEIMALIGCDETVKAHLTKAKTLRNTNEVNELLKKCN